MTARNVYITVCADHTKRHGSVRYIKRIKIVIKFLIFIILQPKKKIGKYVWSARKNLDVRMFIWNGSSVLFFWGLLAVVDAIEIPFFLAFPDANAGFGLVTKNFSSALGVTGKKVQWLLSVVKDEYIFIYLFIFGVDKYYHYCKPVEHIWENSSH